MDTITYNDGINGQHVAELCEGVPQFGADFLRLGLRGGMLHADYND